MRKSEQLLFLMKCLLCSYILTAVLIFLLALLLFFCGLSEGVVNIAIIMIYVISTFAGGLLAGKKMQSKKFLRGMLVGIAYFAGLVVLSAVAKQSVSVLGESFLTTLFLCTAGGMLGGMFG